MPMLAAVALLLFASRCTHDAAAVGTAEPAAVPGMRTVAVPERPDGTALIARVVVGPLPRGARVIVLLENGEIVGSVSPYGTQPAASGGSYTIPVPEHVAAAKELRLRFEVHERGDAPPRAPREGELVDVQLLAVPVKR